MAKGHATPSAGQALKQGHGPDRNTCQPATQVQYVRLRTKDDALWPTYLCVSLVSIQVKFPGLVKVMHRLHLLIGYSFPFKALNLGALLMHLSRKFGQARGIE